jgi:hydroxypyruvate isomerase
MPRLAANLSTLFTEVPLGQRWAAAAAAGFAGVECQFPYAVPAVEIAACLRDLRLRHVLINTPPGEQTGDRGLAGQPQRLQEFRAGLQQAIDYAVAIGCPRIHVMAGMRPPDLPVDIAMSHFVSNLVYAAQCCAPHGITALIEPINTRVDVPGYLLHSTADALECLRRAAQPNLRLQYDVYHMQIMEGDLLRSLTRLLPHIGHIQIADNPGRHEPGSGEINYGFLLPQLDVLGYDGWVGCEYLPSSSTQTSLSWARELLNPQALGAA